MKITSFTQPKFLSLKESQQHKKAGEILRKIHEGDKTYLPLYRSIESWLSLLPLDLTSPEQLSNRFHYHLSLAKLSCQEHRLLHVRHFDTPSDIPFLPIHIYLDRLRSAFNVGSILRTVEAFRLGTVHFCPKTPTPFHPKVQKASMGASSLVPYIESADYTELPRPWICLETASPSQNLRNFPFPKKFTLFLGNEETGITKDILIKADTIVEIPLVGSKNSLNVAAAFAIAAAEIRAQHINPSL